MTYQANDAHSVERGTAILRKQNREWIVSIISQYAPITRGRIGELTKLTGAAVSRITRELIDAGLVVEGDPIEAPGRVGRRENNLLLNPKGAFVLGISITANRRSISLANAAGEVVSSVECNDIPFSDPLEFLAMLSERTKSVVFDADFNRSRLLGIGVSAAISSGREDRGQTDFITSDPLGWERVPVSKYLAERLNMAVKVEHRASAILRGELRNAGLDEDVYLINAALGIGASAYLDGQFYSTTDRGFGLLSHYTDHASDVPCYCGRKGCMEVTASGKAILRDLGASNLAQTKVAEFLSEAIERADNGDEVASKAFRSAGKRMSRGVDAVLTLMEPEKVILAGEVGRQKAFLSGLIAGLENLGRSSARDLVRSSSITSEEAAVSVALHHFLYSGNLDLGRLNAT